MTQARIADVINDNNFSYIEHSVHEKEIHQCVMEGVPPINESELNSSAGRSQAREHDFRYLFMR